MEHTTRHVTKPYRPLLGVARAAPPLYVGLWERRRLIIEKGKENGNEESEEENGGKKRNEMKRKVKGEGAMNAGTGGHSECDLQYKTSRTLTGAFTPTNHQKLPIV